MPTRRVARGAFAPVPVADPSGPRVGVAGVEFVQVLEEEAFVLRSKVFDAEAAVFLGEADYLPGNQAVTAGGFGGAFPCHHICILTRSSRFVCALLLQLHTA